MPFTDIVIVSIITLAFVVFAAALAWGDYQTGEIARESRQRALSGTHAAAHSHGGNAQASGQTAGEKTNTPAHA